MKKLLVMLFVLCSISVYAQDVIVKKDGSTIVCRILELSSSEIVYKRWSDLNGSNYVMNRYDASTINFENGKKFDLSDATNIFKREDQLVTVENEKVNQEVIKHNEMVQIVDPQNFNPNINYQKKARTLRTIGWIGGGVLLATGVVLCCIDYDDKFKYSEYEKEFGAEAGQIIGVCCVGAAVAWTTGFLLAAHHAKKKGDVMSTSIYQQDFKLSNGNSLSIGADMLRDRALGCNTVGLGIRYIF